MANRDLFSGGDYQRQMNGEKSGSWLMSRLFLQGLVALVMFCGVVYLYEQESELGEGVRYVVALARNEQQEALAVSGLGDFWQALTSGDLPGRDKADDTADGGNTVNVAQGATAPVAAQAGSVDYQPGTEYLGQAKLDEDGEPILILPASGLMQSAFGELDEGGLPISGLEIFCQQEQAVKAAAIGEVTEVVDGERIVLKHSGDMETVYGGALTADVAVGDVVSQGEAVGRLGEGVLLFQVLVEGEPQNPLEYVLGPQ